MMEPIVPLGEHDLRYPSRAASSRSGYGHFRGSNSTRNPALPHAASSQAIPSASQPFSTLNATPEDRQRAVAKLLSRGESFSLEREEPDAGYELTPDKSGDASPHLSPVPQPGLQSAPIELSFNKVEVVQPAKPATSGLAGIHRPSADGRPVVQTPNRYAAPVPTVQEFSDSGRKKANRYQCSVFLPTRSNECLQLSLKAGTTAAQAVAQALSEYLRSHTQPEQCMLGQPATYRLAMAEEDGELDDSFPPLDPSCVVSTTGADCFLLQRRAVPAIPSGLAPASLPAEASLRQGVAPGAMPPAQAAAVGLRGSSRARMGGMGALCDSDDSSSSSSDPFADDSDPTARSSQRYLSHQQLGRNSPPPLPSKMRGSQSGGGGAGAMGGAAVPPPILNPRQSHRTSSDAEEDLHQVQAEIEADEEEARRVALANANGAPSTAVAIARTSGSHARAPPVKRKASFRTFSLRGCLSCSCFSPAVEETEPIEPHHRQSRV